jgi:hypothetical protein
MRESSYAVGNDVDMGTEGASLPANLSGHKYRIELATLESGFREHTRTLGIPPKVKAAVLASGPGRGETLRLVTEGEFYPQPSRQENSVTASTDSPSSSPGSNPSTSEDNAAPSVDERLSPRDPRRRRCKLHRLRRLADAGQLWI